MLAQQALSPASTGDLAGLTHLVNLFYSGGRDCKSVRELVASPANRWNLFVEQDGELYPADLDRHILPGEDQDDNSGGVWC